MAVQSGAHAGHLPVCTPCSPCIGCQPKHNRCARALAGDRCTQRFRFRAGPSDRLS
jgi:hypothetical protein